MNDLLNEMQKITAQLADLKTKLHENETARQFDEWIPRKTVMEFFDYGDTQMASLFKSGELVVAEIGNRKFIYKPSIILLLEKNVRK